MSPSRIDYSELQDDQTNVLTTDGDSFYRGSTVSMDTDFHLAIFNKWSDIDATIHTHARYATALAVADKTLSLITYGMFLQLKEDIQCTKYYSPDNPKMNLEIVDNWGKMQFISKNLV